MRNRYLLAVIAIALPAALLVLWPDEQEADVRETDVDRSQGSVSITENSQVPAGQVRAGASDQSIATAAEARSPSTASSSMCRNVPVLPDVEDLVIPYCNGGHRSLALAEEEVDGSWAPFVEARIRALISDQERVRFDRVELACRIATCGVVLILAEDERNEFVPQELTRILIESLAESLGFGRSEIVRSVSQDGIQLALGLLALPEGREPYWPPPEEPQRMEALPGITGFEVTRRDNVPGTRYPMASEVLVAEAVDPAWAPAMEARILREIGSSGIALNQIYVVCRTVRCGVVLDYADAIDPREAIPPTVLLIEQLEEELGLNYCPMSIEHFTMDPSAGFAALYFQDTRGRSICSLDLEREPARSE